MCYLVNGTVMTALPFDWKSVLPLELHDANKVVARHLFPDAGHFRFSLLFCTTGDVRPKRPQRIHFPAQAQDSLSLHPCDLAASLVIDGEATYRTKGPPRLLRPGHVFFFDRRHPRQWQHRLERQPGFCDCSLIINGALAERLRQLGIWETTDGVFPLDPSLPLLSAFVRMWRDLCNHNQSDGTILRRGIGLIDQVHEYIGAGCGDDPLMARACLLLRKHVMPGDSVHRIAEKLGMPYETFRRRFTRAIGIAPRTYQICERMDRARLLLRDHSVKETAAILGYADPFFFSRQFRQHTGASPSHYRK